MKRVLGELLRRGLELAMQLLAVAPLFIIASCGIESGSRALGFMFVAGLAIMCMALSFAPPIARKLLFPVLAALAGVGAFLLPLAEGELTLHLLFCALSVGLVVLLSVVQAHGLTIIMMTAGIPLHLVAAVLANLKACEQVTPLLPPATYLYLIALIFYANWTVYSDQFSRHSMPPARNMKLGNAMMCAVFLGLVFIIHQFDRLRELAGEALRQVFKFIARIIMMLVPTMTPGTGGGLEPGGFEIAKAGEPALIWLVLEKIMYVVGAVASICLFVLALRQLFGLLGRLAIWVKGVLARYFGAIGTDYVDETEVFSGWEELAQGVRANIMRALGAFGRVKPWSEMDNRERVRAAYRRVSRRASSSGDMTAREVLGSAGLDSSDAAAFGDSYDKARYSEHEITDDEAMEARRVSER